jgi:hypothetical protein
MKCIFILLLSVIALQTNAATTIDTGNKQLKREIKKYFPDEKYVLSEIPLPAKFPVQGNFYKISSGIEKLKYIYIGRVITMRGNGKSSADNGEYFDYFILYNSLREVHAVRIFNYQASHGEGITSVGWLKQFNGHNSKKMLEVGKNIDAISGATISVNNITFDIQSKTRILLQIAN